VRGTGNVRRGPIPQIVAVAPTTLSDTDAGTGTETGTIVVTLAGADSGTFTDTGVVSVTATGAETAGDTEAGTVSATVPGSDSGNGDRRAGVDRLPGRGQRHGDGHGDGFDVGHGTRFRFFDRI
jgi:hypothetical protein